MTTTVYCVLPPRFLLLDLAGPLDALRIAQSYGGDLNVIVVAPHPEVSCSFGLQMVGIQALPKSLNMGDVVLISGTIEAVDIYQSHEALIIANWLKQVFNSQQHQIITICSGIFLLGCAGLLTDIECTTHHHLLADLHRLYPRAKVLNNRVFVDTGAILSSAGIMAGMDVILYWLANHLSAGLALQVARHMNVYFRRNPNDPALSPWLLARNHMHQAVHTIQDLIMSDPAAAWPLACLAQKVFVSSRHLSRIFKIHTDMSVHEYHIQLKHVLCNHYLRQGLNQEKAALSAGFSSASAWRRSRANKFFV